MDIVLSKNGVKCAVFKISDVKICFFVLISKKVLTFQIFL